MLSSRRREPKWPRQGQLPSRPTTNITHDSYLFPTDDNNTLFGGFCRLVKFYGNDHSSFTVSISSIPGQETRAHAHAHAQSHRQSFIQKEVSSSKA